MTLVHSLETSTLKKPLPTTETVTHDPPYSALRNVQTTDLSSKASPSPLAVAMDGAKSQSNRLLFQER